MNNPLHIYTYIRLGGQVDPCVIFPFSFAFWILKVKYQTCTYAFIFLFLFLYSFFFSFSFVFYMFRWVSHTLPFAVINSLDIMTIYRIWKSNKWSGSVIKYVTREGGSGIKWHKKEGVQSKKQWQPFKFLYVMMLW